MSRQKYFIGKRTKTLCCPCGYTVHCSTDRERDFKRKLHCRNCDVFEYTNNIKNERSAHRANMISSNSYIHQNLAKERERRKWDKV